MSTILSACDENVSVICNWLCSDQVAAIPTETVYGLAANAYSTSAVQKIFEYKKRPSFNPLISHYLTIEQIKKDAVCCDLFYQLAEVFSPGPLTYILNKTKNSQLSGLVTAGLDTVAVRMPNNTWAQKILKNLEFPLAAPSANLSTKLTNTTAKNVAQSLSTDDFFIFDGGKSVIGIESTVIDLTGKTPVILRYGEVLKEEIAKILKVDIMDDDGKIGFKCPGRMIKHYATEKPLIINAKSCGKNDAYLAFGNYDESKILAKHVKNLSKNGDLCEAASNLFSMLKELDCVSEVQKICVGVIEETGIGKAINDKLKRAAEKE